MSLSDHYEIIKTVHVSSVIVSGSYFFLRGIWMLRGSELINRVWARAFAPIIDTILLVSAILLTIATEQYPFVQHWLTIKLIALLLYIVLGMYALRWGKTRKTHIICFILALLVFAYIVMVALTRNPFVFL